MTLREGSRHETLNRMRMGLRAYNEALGGENTEEAGYHETLTQYYVGAISALRNPETHLHEVLSSSSTTRTAPLKYWSKAACLAPRRVEIGLNPTFIPCLGLNAHLRRPQTYVSLRSLRSSRVL